MFDWISGIVTSGIGRFVDVLRTVGLVAPKPVVKYSLFGFTAPAAGVTYLAGAAALPFMVFFGGVAMLLGGLTVVQWKEQPNPVDRFLNVVTNVALVASLGASITVPTMPLVALTLAGVAFVGMSASLLRTVSRRPVVSATDDSSVSEAAPASAVA